MCVSSSWSRKHELSLPTLLYLYLFIYFSSLTLVPFCAHLHIHGLSPHAYLCVCVCVRAHTRVSFRLTKHGAKLQRILQWSGHLFIKERDRPLRRLEGGIGQGNHIRLLLRLLPAMNDHSLNQSNSIHRKDVLKRKQFKTSAFIWSSFLK